MRRGMMHVVGSGLMVLGVAHAAWAAEQTAEPIKHKVAATGAATAQMTATGQVVATPATASSPAAVPSTEVRGFIAALDLTAAEPMIKVNGADGRLWTVALDAKNTSVSHAGRVVGLDELRVGQSVAIRRATVGGKDVAQSIRILASSSVGSSATPKTQS